jgi:RHO1 GDP-GTP exchange protein 1/2
LLFSLKFIEVRSIASGKLVQVIGRDVRLVHSGLMEEDMLVAAVTGNVEDENGLSEKVLELVPTATIDAQGLMGRVKRHWDEWDL